MPLIDSQKFYREIDSGKIAPFYFIFGEENYLIQQCIDRIKYHTLVPGMEDFNFTQFYAHDAEIHKILDEVDTLPMMVERRLVIVKEAQDFNDKEWAEIEKKCVHPVESTVFVLVAGKIDKRKKYFREIFEQSQAIEIRKPFDNQIPTWINYIAKQLELHMTHDAILTLHRLVGNQLTDIEIELKKLGEYVNWSRKIEMADVTNVIQRSKEENVFDFTKAIGQNDRVKALEHLVHLIDQGQSETGIVALVARHLRILLLVTKGLSEGLGGQKLAHFAQVSPYFLDNYVEQARSWNQKRLEIALASLSEVDRQLKSSSLEGRYWLEDFVLKNCI